MEVLGPGVRGAEGKEKGKGVVVRRGLEEAQSKDAGQRTGTGYEVWYAWGELARDSKALHPRWGVLYKSGVHASKVVCLTPGGLHGVYREGRLSEERSEPSAVQKSAEGIVGTDR